MAAFTNSPVVCKRLQRPRAEVSRSRPQRSGLEVLQDQVQDPRTTTLTLFTYIGLLMRFEIKTI